MNPSLFRPAASAFVALSVIYAVPSLAQSAPHLPDFSSYNCAGASASANTMHIGQVINGTYHEWNEYYVVVQGQPRLACIGLMRPTARQLSADEAKTFLSDSFAVGAPAAAPAAARDRQQSAPADEEPADVQPEPLKRLRKPPTPTGTFELKSNVEELPPLPASKTFDSDTSAPAAPAKERAKVAPAIAPEGNTASPKTVGVEDREQIPNTQVYPWNTLAYLSATYPNNQSFRCSATLVSPYVVLTAGHCIHNKNRGGYVSTIRIYPGQSQAVPTDNTPVRPYGFKSDAQSLETTATWTQISGEDTYLITEFRHDMAAVEFRTPFTHTSTFMPVLYSSTGVPITNAGYPGEVNNNTNYGLWADTGGETQDSVSDYRSNHVREFAVDATQGNSGGPFIYVNPSSGQRYLVGSLSYSDDLDDASGGPWYDSWNQSLVSAWVSWTPGSAAAGAVNGTRVASVFSSAHPTIMSFLRFYNSGNASGTVDLTLADSVSGATLATWTSPSLPGHSSRQFSMQEIEDGASATFTKPPIYSISVRPTFSGSFQNTILRKIDVTFSNLSTCDTQGPAQTTLMNVHSSILQSNYPSAVIIHNTSSSTVAPSLTIFNARDGQILGTYQAASIAANGQLVLGVPTIEAGAGVSPGSTIYHYNLRIVGSFTGYMQHLVNNVAAGVTNDMSASCALTP